MEGLALVPEMEEVPLVPLLLGGGWSPSRQAGILFQARLWVQQTLPAMAGKLGLFVVESALLLVQK